MRLMAIFTLCFVIIFISCSTDDADISSVSHQVIFDYSNYNSVANMRLSAFAQVDGDIKKASHITVECQDAGLSWQINEPIAFNSGSNKWAGTTNMVMQEGTLLHLGNYEITYEDLSQEEGKAQFYVYYPKELIGATAFDAQDFMLQDCYIKLALYDKNKDLIYFNEPKKNWNSPNEVLQDLGNSLYYRYCYISKDGGYSCLMPLTHIAEFYTP